MASLVILISRTLISGVPSAPNRVILGSTFQPAAYLGESAFHFSPNSEFLQRSDVCLTGGAGT